MKAIRSLSTIVGTLAVFAASGCSSPFGQIAEKDASTPSRSIVQPVTVYGSVAKVDKTTVKIDGNITSFSAVNPNTDSPWIDGAGSVEDSAVQEINTGDDAAVFEGSKFGPLTITKVHLNSSGAKIGIDFVSEIPVLAIAMKGGNGYNVFMYDEPGAASDTWVYTPDNASGGPAAISHLVVAWKPRVLVAADARPAFDRDWDWTIAKTNDASVGADLPNSQAYPQMIHGGSSWTVVYTVSGSADFVDHNFRVAGTIVVSNPAYNKTEAVIGSVADVIDGNIQAAVSGSLPVAIPAGSSATFTYGASLAGKADFASLWTAAAAPGSPVHGNSLSATTSFGSEPAAQTDLSIAIADDLEPALGNRTIALPEGQASPYSYGYSYPHAILSTDAGDGSAPVRIRNVVSFAETDRESVVAFSDVWARLHLAAVGYVRSMGYWKTHAASSYQNRPLYDPTWNAFRNVDGSFKPFFSAAPQSYIDVMWTAPRGNVYYNLAAQYVGAKLNVGTGHVPGSAVLAAIARAEYYFGLYAPKAVAGWKSNDPRRQEMIAIAGALEGYNTSSE